MKKYMQSIWFVAAILLLTTCKKNDDDPLPENPPGRVTIQNHSFNPATLTISRGATVTWTNNDTEVHTITADDNTFNSPSLNNGGTYSRTFSEARTVRYHCTPHPEMQGTIVITQSEGTSPRY